jgi:hypothetical protein
MEIGTERLIKKFARGFERGSDSSARYIASEDMQGFITELVSVFSGIGVRIRKDRGQGLLLSVLQWDTWAVLYSVHIRNTNTRGLVRSPVRYCLEIENRDVIVGFR